MKLTTFYLLGGGVLLALVGFGYLLSTKGIPPEDAVKVNFESANRALQEGKAEKAAGIYNELIEGGQLSAAVFYNLGIAQHLTGDLGAAVLSFERAAALDPGSGDIVANLQRTQMDAGAISPADNGWDKYAGTLSPSSWSILGALSLLTLSAIAVATGSGILSFPPKLAGTFVLVCCLLIALSATAITIHHRAQCGRAVVVANGATLRVSPFDEAKSVTALPPGKTIHLLPGETHGSFTLARLQTGQAGWLKKNEFKSITGM